MQATRSTCCKPSPASAPLLGQESSQHPQLTLPGKRLVAAEMTSDTQTNPSPTLGTTTHLPPWPLVSLGVPQCQQGHLHAMYTLFSAWILRAAERLIKLISTAVGALGAQLISH